MRAAPKAYSKKKKMFKRRKDSKEARGDGT
jgi:hypothetical protein